MFNKLIKSIRHPQKALRYIEVYIKALLCKRKETLFILGMDNNGVFGLLFRGYEKCYGFEPNSERFNKLSQKYKKYKNVHLYNVAVAQQDGVIDFNISSNNGASSSIGTFKEEWRNLYSDQIKMIKSIRVPCINLYNFCKKNNIDFIDDYVSDIQGMDLEILKTIKPMIDNKMIGTITCEVTKDDKQNIYSDLSNNSESGFTELLFSNYDLVAKGSGILKDNKFDKIPDDVWEMDCKWKLRADI